jgi:outer membrane protein
MTKLLKITFIALLFFAANTAFAQKFGHLNAGNLLEAFPDVRKADTTLVKLQESLSVKGQGMLKKLETDYNKYMQDSNAGIITPAQAKVMEADLQKQQEAIDKYRQEITGQLEQKRQELLKPILEKIDIAIKAIGKENGYAMIFDISAGSMLYAMESQDITGLVKAKLGLK